jgi:hypothetical protein
MYYVGSRRDPVLSMVSCQLIASEYDTRVFYPCRLYWYLIEFIDWRNSQACWYFGPLL